jgi:hypothetical protein
MKQRTLSVIGLFALLLIGTAAMGNLVAGYEMEPDAIDITIERVSFFVKGYMKHGLTFDLGAEYYSDVNVDATFTHFRSGRVFAFDFEDTLNGQWYTFPDMKKMPSGLYHIVIHITSV